MKYILPVITAIAGIAIAVFFMRACSPKVIPVVKIDTVYHDTTIYKEKLVPVPYEVLVAGKPIKITKRDTILVDSSHLTATDSIQVFRDHFSVRKYSDTLHGGYGSVVVNTTVTQNKLTDLQSIFRYSVPEITKSTTENLRKGYVGFDAGGGKGYAEVSGILTYIDKRDNAFHVRAGYATPGWFIAGGYQVKISLGKK